MAKVINTQFDNPIDQDVALEEIDGKSPAVQVTLKNAENVYKSFLYLRKMYSKFPAKENILSINTVSLSSYTSEPVPDGANYIVVNNISTSSSAGIKINGGEYVLRVGEKIKLPVVCEDSNSSPAITADNVELKGDISFIYMNIQEY